MIAIEKLCHRQRRNDSGPGYLYFVRFEDAKNCYKIGITDDIYRRLFQFGKYTTELIVLAHVENKSKVESELHYRFQEYNNSYKFAKAMKMRTRDNRNVLNFQYRGGIDSVEHFTFPHTSIVCEVICTFEDLCDDIQLGTDNKLFGLKNHRKTIGYGEERLKYYDEENHRYVPYPTEFGEDGWPICKPYEEWDSIPYSGPEPEHDEILIHK